MQGKTTIKHTLTRIMVRSWWHMPLSRQGREAIKTLVFTVLPFLFRNTRVYRNWDYTRSLGKPDFSFRSNDFPAHWPANQSDHTVYRKPSRQPGPVQPLAIIVHVYYPELFAGMLDRLHSFAPDQCKMFVSTTAGHLESLKEMLENAGYRYHLEPFANCGRDVLPFLRLATQAQAEGYHLLLKLHTKKSDHRMSGALWREDIYDSLLDAGLVRRVLEVFAQHPEVGLLGPVGH